MIRTTFLLLVFLTACIQTPQELEPGLESEAYTQRFYVATTGNDSNPGTLAVPFRTIQKCASIATPGTICYVRSGIYRETVRPANSGQSGSQIVFKPYNNEKVLISGADVVQNWTANSGAIYKAPVSWDLGAGNNQVFVDGKMMIEARYPNAGLDLLAPWNGKFVNPRGSNVTYTIDATNVPATIAGANINFLTGPEWVIETGKITTATPSSFTFTSPDGQLAANVDFDPSLYVPRPGNPYFIWGKRVLLDSANEWFLENGQLYLWTPKGDNPSTHTVEVKRRSYAFDLTDRSFIFIEGFQVFAATITTGDISKSANDATAQNITLQSIHVRYPSHFTYVNSEEGGWGKGRRDTGIILYGRNHTLKNSTVAFSAGNGVVIAGSNHRVTNNIIHDVGYAITDTNTIKAGSYDFSSRAALIQNNTLYDTGRSVMGHIDAKALKILNNHLYNAGLIANDLGMVGSPGDGGGTEIAYNIVHDNFAPSESVGIYLDNDSSNYTVHHNIVYNVKSALALNLPTKNNRIYNNTLVGFKESVTSGAARLPQCNATGTELINNIFSAGFNLGFIFDGTTCPNGTGLPTFINNLEQTTDPRFGDAPDANFVLGAGSPAINKGRVLSPYTNGYRGSAPDMGALESGLAPFSAGATITEPCVYGDSCTPKPNLHYGVVAQYFSDENLTTSSGVRLEGTFDFGYFREGTIPPGSFLPRSTNYSARWSSHLRAPVTGTYTFTVTTDDSARFWLNGTQYVDRWDAPSESTFTVTLQAGQYYDTKLEMRQGTGDSQAKLEWAYAGQPKRTIPMRYLTINKP
jgi:PA14 domain/Right handed beta helix region